MIVWVLIVTLLMEDRAGGYGNVTGYHIDNIESAASCEQLAKTVRNAPHPQILAGSVAVTAICAPVRKAVAK